MAIQSKEEWDASQKNIPAKDRTSYNQYLSAIGITPEDAAMRVAAQQGQSRYQGDTFIDRSGTGTYVLPAGTKQLTPEQLKAVTGETQVRNVIDAATGKLVLFNNEGQVFQGEPGDLEGYYRFLNPRATGNAGMLQAGIASGTFVKNKDGSWSIGKGGEGGSTTGAGFARLLARLGFDATMVRPGESIFIGDDGLVKYKGKKYEIPSPEKVKQLQNKINTLIQTGIIAGGGTDPALGRTVGGASGFEPGTKISDVLPPEAWPPGYKWDTPIPLEGIPATRSNHQLEITKETLGPYYEQYAKMAGLSNSSTGAVSGFGSGTGYGAGAGAGAGFGPGGSSAYTGMTAGQQDIYSTIVDRLNRYNLGSLAPLIRKLAIEGATESTIMLQLQEDPLYKERFKANEIRRQKGLAVLSPSEYLTLEDDYRQVLRAYGLNQFDNDAYVSQFLANDMSVSELSNRVVSAVQRVRNADPAVSSMLKSMYGIGQNDLVAYVLDPQQQFQKIERQIAASEIGVAAARQGFNVGTSVAEQLAAQGITQAEAQRGYATIADILPTAEKLSDIYGKELQEYRLAEGEQEVFNQLASAQRKRRALSERELASFSGQSGMGRTSLTQQPGGQF